MFFFFFSIEVESKEASRSVEYMKMREEKKPRKVCYFTFVTLFVPYACQLKMEYIHKKKTR